MVAVLGIDAAWTSTNDSGYALIVKEAAKWRLVAAESNLRDFARACGSGNTDELNAALAISSAMKALEGNLPDVVAVDMPLSKEPIATRRISDNAISRQFGAAKCSTHSPSTLRPGEVGRALQRDAEKFGYTLMTSEQELPPLSLIEVYPHPALLSLMGVSERVKYKVGKTARYWPGTAREERRLSVKAQLRQIVERLDQVIVGCASAFRFDESSTFSGLKRAEDKVDAIVSAWVGAMFSEGRAEPFGDEVSAIWVPRE